VGRLNSLVASVLRTGLANLPNDTGDGSGSNRDVGGEDIDAGGGGRNGVTAGGADTAADVMVGALPLIALVLRVAGKAAVVVAECVPPGSVVP
jgi:hypothetical protein